MIDYIKAVLDDVQCLERNDCSPLVYSQATRIGDLKRVASGFKRLRPPSGWATSVSNSWLLTIRDMPDSVHLKRKVNGLVARTRCGCMMNGGSGLRRVGPLGYM